MHACMRGTSRMLKQFFMTRANKELDNLLILSYNQTPAGQVIRIQTSGRKKEKSDGKQDEPRNEGCKVNNCGKRLDKDCNVTRQNSI